MFEKLEAVEARFRELESKSADPVLCADGQAYTALMKEYKKLEPLVFTYREWKRSQKETEEAKILASGKDADLAELACFEVKVLSEQTKDLAEQLKFLLLPKDENDDRNVIVEIRACAGGEEAALFAADLYRMYSMYAANNDYTISLLSANETELGGYRELVFSVSGNGAYSRFKFESGVHRVQRVPVTESQGRIQTSTVTVAVLPEAKDVEVKIDPADVVMESCKSSGAGGQHINKTESAVRLTHKPTGIVVECQEERSQYKNRDKAMKMLRTKLLAIERESQHKEISDKRRAQVGSGDRSEKIRTYNYHESRVTDHRIGLTLYSLEKVLAGDLSQLFDALSAADTAEKMQKETEGELL